MLIKKLLSHWNFYLLKSNKTLVYYNLVLAEELLNTFYVTVVLRLAYVFKIKGFVEPVTENFRIL